MNPYALDHEFDGLFKQFLDTSTHPRIFIRGSVRPSVHCSVGVLHFFFETQNLSGDKMVTVGRVLALLNGVFIFCAE